MNPTPRVTDMFYPTPYQNTPMNPPEQDGGELSTFLICVIVLAAVIALLIIIFLIIMIYNFCRYGSCCPPSGYCRCCGPWTQRPTEVTMIKPTPIIRSVRSLASVNGSYVSRGTRLNPMTYEVEPRAFRSGTLPRTSGRVASARNSVIIVEEGTAPRRHVVQPVRPQIIVSDGCYNGGRASTISRGLLTRPSSSSSDIRCFTRNDPIMSGNLNDDGDVRVIVRNQPYASQNQIIYEGPMETASFMSPPPAFENLTTYSKSGEMGFNDGLTINEGISNGGFGYGFTGQHSATIDVILDEAPDYTSDDNIQHFQQSSIYPTLEQTNYY